MKNYQISLFERQEEELQWKLAHRICDEFNRLDTVFQFFVSGVKLEQWTHVKKENKTLEINISAFGVSTQNSFIQFGGDKQSQYNINNCLLLSDYLGELSEDKDFTITITPWSIYIFYDNFEEKDIKLN